MCGIAGLVGKTTESINPGLLTAMTEAIVHRGPDGSGEFLWRNVGLGHRRLSIIDLSDEGRQPMFYRNDSLVLTYNGEIYNYKELRAELISRGHSFRSQTDSEVILAAYVEWGDACVERFNGMWALALLDKERKKLFCSRDRFGVKPFYYLDRPDCFSFGSEIRQLLPMLPRIESQRDLLVDFLLTSISDHTDQTFFKNIVKLPAGHNLNYDLATNEYEINRYYRIQRKPDLAELDPVEASEAFMAVFEDAVRLRLRADVAVGTCLSGGLDSSSVATIAAPYYFRQSSQPFSAITAVSELEKNNEAGFAETVVNAGGMAWLPVKPDYRDFVDSLESVVNAQEEPFGSSSLTMQYFVMKTAKDHGIPVLLDGQGGDETLLGYEKYYASYLATTFREQGVKAFFQALASASDNNAKMSPVNAGKYLVAGLLAPMRYGFYRYRHRYLSGKIQFPQHLRDFSGASWDVFALQELEITKLNLPVLLRYEDKNSMAHSIEARLPFLDYRVVETALSLPGYAKIRNGWSKWALRKGMEGRMPDTIVWRKNKFGFEAPEDIWMTRHAAEMKTTVLASPLLKEITRQKILEKNYQNLDVRSQWRLYSVALWEKAFKVTN